MEAGKVTSSYVTYTFAWHEFLDRLGIPRDADVIQVRTTFSDGGSFTVIATDKERP